MSILERLSSSRGERGNVADIALAEELSQRPNTTAIRELVEHLNVRDRRLQSDCMKTLYEIGERAPELIAEYVKDFASHLASKNPRMIWGAMCALDGCASANPNGVYAHLDAIVKAAEGESVIARDHCVNILAKLTNAGHAKKCFPILLEIIRHAPINQLPAYCERAATAVPEKENGALAALINLRLAEVEQKPKRVRMERVLRKLS